MKSSFFHQHLFSRVKESLILFRNTFCYTWWNDPSILRKVISHGFRNSNEKAQVPIQWTLVYRGSCVPKTTRDRWNPRSTVVCFILLSLSLSHLVHPVSAHLYAHTRTRPLPWEPPALHHIRTHIQNTVILNLFLYVSYTRISLSLCCESRVVCVCGWDWRRELSKCSRDGCTRTRKEVRPSARSPGGCVSVRGRRRTDAR